MNLINFCDFGMFFQSKIKTISYKFCVEFELTYYISVTDTKFLIGLHTSHLGLKDCGPKDPVGSWNYRERWNPQDFRHGI